MNPDRPDHSSPDAHPPHPQPRVDASPGAEGRLTALVDGESVPLTPVTPFGVAVGLHRGVLYEAPLPVGPRGDPPPLEPRRVRPPVDSTFLAAVNRALGTTLTAEDIGAS